MSSDDIRDKNIKEKREYERNSAEGPAKLRYILDEKRSFGMKNSQSYIQGRVIDVSEGGASFRVPHPPTRFDQMEVYIAYDGFWGRVEVKYVESVEVENDHETEAYRIGVKYIEKYK